MLKPIISLLREGYTEKEYIQEILVKNLKVKDTWKPSEKTILEVLEECYIKKAGKWGTPVHVGGEHIWKRKGLYEEVNRELERRGYRRISWVEWRRLLGKWNSKYQGKIYTSFIVAPVKGLPIEPVTIAIYKPVTTEHNIYMF